MKDTKIGFIGQGWIGKHLADNFQERGFKNLVRYAKEPEYAGNADAIRDCSIVFVAVPTPTKGGNFDDSILRQVLPLTSPTATVVVKSTVLPDTLRKLTDSSRGGVERKVLHSPEFLSVSTAREDTDFPDRNILGLSDMEDPDLLARAKEVMGILPKAPYEKVCTYEEAALIKYGGNCFFFVKNVFFNMLADLTQQLGADPEVVREAVAHDRRIHPVHTKPVDKGGRGAGGVCLPKDFAAFRAIFNENMPIGDAGHAFLYDAEERNLHLLKLSRKDLAIIDEVYEGRE